MEIMEVLFWLVLVFGCVVGIRLFFSVIKSLEW